MNWKVWMIAAFVLLGIMAAGRTEAHAGFISGDEALGGFSYYLNRYEGTEAKEYIDERIELMNFQREEYEILCRIVEAEATGGTVEQKRNVASCVLARVASKNWPNTVKGVVFQKRQFSPIDDGRYYTVTITESTREAVNLTYNEGWTHKCEYFCTPTCRSAKTGYHSKLNFQFCDGMHNYYE